MADGKTIDDDVSGWTREFRAFFAEAFARMDASPRRVVLKLVRGGVAVDLIGGEPVFVAPDGRTAKANFRGRWLAEHPVPLALRAGDRLALVPASGNRVKVRRATFWERMFG